MLEQPKADVMTRFLAALIDGVLSGAISMIIPVVGAIISTAYLLIKDGLFEGQSLGKKLMKLQVVTMSGEKPDFAISAKRNVIFAIPSIIMIIPILGWVIAPILALIILIIEVLKVVNEPQGRRMGDNWADTQVIPFVEGTQSQNIN